MKARLLPLILLGFLLTLTVAKADRVTIWTGQVDGISWELDGNWTNGTPKPGLDGIFGHGENDLGVTGDSWVRAGQALAGDAESACCVGSTCVLTTANDCADQGGYFHPGVVFCGPSLCATGACCVPDQGCVDEAGGEPVDEELCDIMGGTYLGGGACDQTDPCDLWGPPPGYEVVQIAFSATGQIGHPRINNCGQVVFLNRIVPLPTDVLEIFLYDNGTLTQITDNDYKDSLPDLDDHGFLYWSRSTSPGSGFDGIIRYDSRTGEEWVLATNSDAPGSLTNPVPNRHGHVVWYLFDWVPCTSVSDIQLYDGEKIRTVFADGMSNQTARINDREEIVWTRYVFPCPFSTDWTSTIMLYSQGEIIPLPSSRTQPQTPDINDVGVCAWGTANFLESWENGKTTHLGDGDRPVVNNRGDMAYNTFPLNHPLGYQRWEVWLMRDGVARQLSDPGDEYANNIGGINDAGEVVWKRNPQCCLTPVSVQYMRRIRTGDVDGDGVVDLADFARFPGCFTGPVETDRLCECRFLDINHDRTVDWDDFDLFLENYTGPDTDCMGRSLRDVAEGIIDGTIQDCNVNGVPDECDLSAGTSLDVNGNGIPDECDCPAFEPIHVNVVPSLKSRYISFTPRVAYWRAGTAFVDPPLTGERAAIRVKIVDLDNRSEFNGQVRWVGPPVEHPDVATPFGKYIAAPLQCEPYYADWSQAEYMHVYGDAIIPNSTYEVQIVAESCTAPLLDESKFSSPTTVTTGIWGDTVAPFGASQPNFGDVSAIIDGFRGLVTAPIIPRVDLVGSGAPGSPNVPDMLVNFADVSAGLDAFRGLPYAYTVPACP